MQNMLKERNLPELKSREEMLEILQREEYGYLPEPPEAETNRHGALRSRSPAFSHNALHMKPIIRTFFMFFPFNYV